eukprot:CAMPEP_0173124728 /NCGR_PEP_ID=MMETSP1102-20130122/55879_1 /TAXON_ID=49646 /ORGANISM="Geminigera sp., Strain Caron Lab Isolate" /LENGTH=53 /DNA_ID=CAMNT_0014033231 /DNA_START=1829 /DNA_END=1986 /DNA_ORIENTATION=-
MAEDGSAVQMDRLAAMACAVGMSVALVCRGGEHRPWRFTFDIKNDSIASMGTS